MATSALLSRSPASTVPAGCVFGASLAVYAATCYRGAAGGDSAEFVVTGALFPRVVAHPPGYPLYSALVAAAVRVAPTAGLGPAHAANLLSCVLGAAAAAALETASAELLDLVYWDDATEGLVPYRRLCSCLSAALFATHPAVWLYALQAEVFALNNFLMAVLLALFLRATRAERQGDDRLLWCCALAGSLVIGLALANQHTSALFSAPLACGVLALRLGGSGDCHRRALLRRPRLVAALAACTLCGLSPYAYVPLAQSRAHMFTWPAEASELSGFLAFILRRDYGTFQLQGRRRWEYRSDPGGASGDEGRVAVDLALNRTSFGASKSWGGFMSRAATNGRHFVASATAQQHSSVHAAIALPSALLGVASCMLRLLPCCRGSLAARADRPLLVAFVGLLGALATYLLVMCSLSNLDLGMPVMNGVLDRFWQQPLLVLAPLQAVGLAQALALLLPRSARPYIAAVELLVGAAATLAVAAVLGMLWAQADHSGDSVIEDFYGCMLQSLPQNATVLVRGDSPTNVMRYWQAIRGIRQDVLLVAAPLLSARMQRLAGGQVLHTYGVHLPPGPGLKPFLEALGDLPRRPLVLIGYYGTLGPRASSAWPLPGFDLWPLPGPAWLVLRDDEAARLDALKWAKQQLRRCQCTPSLRRAPAPGVAWQQLAAGSWEFAAAASYWAQAERIVVHAVQWAVGRSSGSEQERAVRAAARLGGQLLRAAPDISPALARTVGLAYHLLNETEEWLHIWGTYASALVPAGEVPMQARLRAMVCAELRRQAGGPVAVRVLRAAPGLSSACDMT